MGFAKQTISLTLGAVMCLCLLAQTAAGQPDTNTDTVINKADVGVTQVKGTEKPAQTAIPAARARARGR